MSYEIEKKKKSSELRWMCTEMIIIIIMLKENDKTKIKFGEQKTKMQMINKTSSW